MSAPSVRALSRWAITTSVRAIENGTVFCPLSPAEEVTGVRCQVSGDGGAEAGGQRPEVRGQRSEKGKKLKR